MRRCGYRGKWWGRGERGRRLSQCWQVKLLTNDGPIPILPNSVYSSRYDTDSKFPLGGLQSFNCVP